MHTFISLLSFVLFTRLFVLCFANGFFIATALAKVNEEVAAEIAALAAAAPPADPDAEDGGAAAPAVSELLKPYREAAAVLENVWNPAVARSGIAAGNTYFHTTITTTITSMRWCWIMLLIETESLRVMLQLSQTYN
jgi:hypothetical protein